MRNGRYVDACHSCWFKWPDAHKLFPAAASDDRPRTRSTPRACGAGMRDEDIPFGMTLADVLAMFSRWLHIPDPSPLYAVLGTVAANRLDGDAVWLLLVGPPGGGKSELLTALSNSARRSPCGDAHRGERCSQARRSASTTRRRRAGCSARSATSGSSSQRTSARVLSMNRDARSALLAALREVYDGSWTRHVGTDGGKTLSWSGKVGLVGGCTPTIDRHHAVMGAMGERFLLLRLPDVDADRQAGEALAHAGREPAMRRELAEAVRGLLGGALGRSHESAPTRRPSASSHSRRSSSGRGAPSSATATRARSSSSPARKRPPGS